MAYGKFVNNPNDIPTGEHWAIIEGHAVTIPGDERSRTNPGHGYPEHTERYVTYEAFTDKAVFEAELERRLIDTFHRTVRGIHVAGVLTHKTKVQFEEQR